MFVLKVVDYDVCEFQNTRNIIFLNFYLLKLKNAKQRTEYADSYVI